MKRLLIALMVAPWLISCGSKKGGSAPAPAPRPEQTNNLFNVPATGNPSDLTTFLGLWESRPALRVGNSTRISRIRFTSGQITVTLECRYNDGEVIYATVVGQGRVEDSGDYTVLEKKQVESTPKSPNNEATCIADINPGTILRTSITNGQIAAQTPAPDYTPYAYIKIAD